MAKGQYKKWLEKDNLLLLQGWKRNGLTDEEIANNIGVAPRTLERWKAKFSQICRVLKIGKEKANFAVENKLFEKAMKGNTAAMIFFLKNNWRDKYSEHPKTDAEKALDKAKTELATAQTEAAREEIKASSQKRDNLSKKMEKFSSEELKAYMKAYKERVEHDSKRAK